MLQRGRLVEYIEQDRDKVIPVNGRSYDFFRSTNPLFDGRRVVEITEPDDLQVMRGWMEGTRGPVALAFAEDLEEKRDVGRLISGIAQNRDAILEALGLDVRGIAQALANDEDFLEAVRPKRGRPPTKDKDAE